MTAASVENLGSIFADPTASSDPVAWHATAPIELAGEPR
jgi:hypothetical protein